MVDKLNLTDWHTGRAKTVVLSVVPRKFIHRRSSPSQGGVAEQVVEQLLWLVELVVSIKLRGLARLTCCLNQVKATGWLNIQSQQPYLTKIIPTLSQLVFPTPTGWLNMLQPNLTAFKVGDSNSQRMAQLGRSEPADGPRTHEWGRCTLKASQLADFTDFIAS